MEQYLNTPIKELIASFPEVGKILEDYNIGCVPCNVGSCLFKDIMEIHNLPEGDERQLLSRIAEVIYPGKKVEIPVIKKKISSNTGEFKYSPPVRKLVDEHLVIKQLLAFIPDIINNLDLSTEEGRQTVRSTVDFIRSYADKYHHAKEEEILFKYFDPGLDILKVMLEDHETARAHVRAILGSLDKSDAKGIADHLNAYRELLKEHIKREDEILYPWIERNLSTSQIGQLFSQFTDVDQSTDSKAIDASLKFIETLEKRYKKNKQKEALK